MQIIKDQTFRGVPIVMDGTYFQNCSFEDCTIIYCGGDFGWGGASFVRCKVDFQGPAVRMYLFMKNIGFAKEPTPQAPPISTNTSGFVN